MELNDPQYIVYGKDMESVRETIKELPVVDHGGIPLYAYLAESSHLEDTGMLIECGFPGIEGVCVQVLKRISH